MQTEFPRNGSQTCLHRVAAVHRRGLALETTCTICHAVAAMSRFLCLAAAARDFAYSLSHGLAEAYDQPGRNRGVGACASGMS